MGRGQCGASCKGKGRDSARARLRGMNRSSVGVKSRSTGKGNKGISLRGAGGGGAKVRFRDMGRDSAGTRTRSTGRGNDAETTLRVLKKFKKE